MANMNRRDYPRFDADGPRSIQEWIDTLKKYKKKYGKDALIEFDAGWSNVEGVIIP